MFSKGNMSKMMKKAQELQSKMAEAQKELSEIKVEGQSGGGMVKAYANGHKDILSIDIDPEILSEDKDMIEDLVVAAVNQALKEASLEAEKKMSSATGGMMSGLKLPGM